MIRLTVRCSVQYDQLTVHCSVQYDQLTVCCSLQDDQLIVRVSMVGVEEGDRGGPMLALHRSLASSLYRTRLQDSYNMWSCIIVTGSALVSGGLFWTEQSWAHATTAAII